MSAATKHERFVADMRDFEIVEALHKPVASEHEKAALKTRALQTLSRGPMPPEVAKRLECVRFIGAFAQ